MDDGLKWIAAALLAGVLVLAFTQWREMSEATRIQENQGNLRRTTVDYLNDIRSLHNSDCKADTAFWTAIDSARKRVASVEAGAQLTHAYEIAYWACRDQE